MADDSPVDDEPTEEEVVEEETEMSVLEALKVVSSILKSERFAPMLGMSSKP
jgi:hypothetical protein